MSKFSVIVADCPWSFSDGFARMKLKTKRSAQSNYDTMSVEEIKTLPIPEITDPEGALLCLWVPSSLLPDGLDIMRAWGFDFKQTYIWVKQKKNPLEVLKKPTKDLIKTVVNLESITNSAIINNLSKTITYMQKTFNLNNTLGIGMGRIFRQSHEVCLLGINNSGLYDKLVNKSQRSVSFAINEGHSIKPELLQDSLDLMFPQAEKLELFARRQRPGWTCLGNQAPATMEEDIRVSLARLIDAREKGKMKNNE